MRRLDVSLRPPLRLRGPNPRKRTSARFAIGLPIVLGGLMVHAEAWAAPPLAPLSPQSSLADRFADGDVDAFDALGHASRGLERGFEGRRPFEVGRRGGVFLTLGANVERTERGEGRGGFVVLGLPLDDLALPSPRPRASPGEHALYMNAALEPLLARVSSNVSIADERPTESPPPSASYARALVGAAYRAAGVGEGTGRLDELASRARKSALLPEMRLRVTRHVDDRASVDALPEQSRLTDSSAQNLGLEARLTFRLDRLVFADEEPSLERARLDVESFRARLAHRVIELLYKHHRARALSREAGPDRDEAIVLVTELGATLDVLTGGWFSRNPR